eukprot:5103539-Pleurochrysis_carterae.AAC.1
MCIRDSAAPVIGATPDCSTRLPTNVLVSTTDCVKDARRVAIRKERGVFAHEMVLLQPARE